MNVSVRSSQRTQRCTVWLPLLLAIAFTGNCGGFTAWAPTRRPISKKSPCQKGKQGPTSKGGRIMMAAKNDDRDFWTQQQELAEEMTVAAELSLKQEQMVKFEERSLGLVADTAFFAMLIFPLLWGLFDNPLFSLSYLLGATFGLAYVYGLGKYVATLGGSVDDTDSMQGAGVGGARFAFLILLIIFVGKFRSEGLVELPTIAGFFTYQLASLSQGMKDISD